jgi:K+-transporting ATPase ATPase C chain
MKKYIIPSIRITIVLTIVLCVIYPVSIMLAGKLSKGAGNGETVVVNGKVVGYANVGQSFTKPQYFWGRPSAVAYNAAGSGGSNKGPSNPDYLKDVSNRIDTLLKYHPYLKRSDIPADLVTASGSGLDPDLSPESVKIQIKRVANFRKLDEQKVAALVDSHIEAPLLGLFGPPKVNVLKLNVALDQLK